MSAGKSAGERLLGEGVRGLGLEDPADDAVGWRSCECGGEN